MYAHFTSGKSLWQLDIGTLAAARAQAGRPLSRLSAVTCPYRRPALWGVLCCAVIFLSACVEEYKVVVVNHRNEQVVIGIGQFHSEGFNGIPPKDFSSALLVRHQEFTLKARESRILLFNSAAGGFWLRWRLLVPLSEPGNWLTLDLARDERVINVR